MKPTTCDFGLFVNSNFFRYDKDNDVTYASTEFIHRVGESVPGPDLPYPLRSHVAVQLTEIVTIVIGK